MRDFFKNLFIKKSTNPWIQFFRYFFSGGTAFAVYFVMLFVFTEYFLWHHMVSLVIAYGLSIFVNFFISKYFVFSIHGEKSGQQILKFFTVAFTGLFLQYVFVSLFTGVFNLQYLWANVIASALVYVVSFTLNRIFTFKP